MTNSKIIALAFATTLAAAPAFAQTSGATIGNAPQNGTSTTAPGSVGMGSTGTGPMSGSTRSDASRPSNTNPVLTDNGDVRASKVIGSSVYNEKNEKVGAIDDIILGKDNKPAQVVVSVGGFLGLGSKLVAVPYEKLQFGNTRENSDNRVMMPGATKDTLTSMSDYHYASAS
jgi:sporulation protein YlmC with PRC-barrel domain